MLAYSQINSIWMEVPGPDFTCADFTIEVQGEFSTQQYYSCYLEINSTASGERVHQGPFVRPSSASLVECKFSPSILNITTKNENITMALTAVYMSAVKQGTKQALVSDPNVCVAL